MALTLQIGLCTDDEGPLPPSMRPGVFNHSFPITAEASAFYALPNLALVRASIDPYFGNDVHEFLDNIQNILDTDDSYFVGLLRAGKRVLLANFISVPPWFRRSGTQGSPPIVGQGGQGVPNAYPPDLVLFEKLTYTWVKKFVDAGINMDLLYLGLGNEIANGPSASPENYLTGFSGPMEDYFPWFAAYAHGALRAAPGVRVGGAQFGGSGGGQFLMADPGSYRLAIERFLQLCANPGLHIYGGARIPLRYLSFHRFSDIPWFVDTSFLDQIEAVGYDLSTVEVICDESNMGNRAGAPQPLFAGEQGASGMALRCQLFADFGVDYYCYALIREGNITNTATGYDGQSGLYAKVSGGAHNNEWVPATNNHIPRMLSRLGPRLIDYQLSDDAYTLGITVTATANGADRWIMIVRDSNRNSQYPGTLAPGDFSSRFAWEAKRQGLQILTTATDPTSTATGGLTAYETGMTLRNILDYVADTYTPRVGLPADVLTKLADVKTMMQTYTAAWAGNVDLTYAVDDHGAVTTLTEYAIGAGTVNNSRAAYIATRGSNSGLFDAGVAAAIAEGLDLTATFTGSGADFPRTITLGPFSVVLIHAVGNGAANPNANGWAPKPIDPNIGLFLGSGEIGTDPVNASRLKGIPRGYDRAQYFPEQPLTFGSVVPWDLDTHQHARLTVTGPCTISTPDNMHAGEPCVLRVIQGGSGGFVPAFSAAFRRIPTRWSQVPGSMTLLSFYSTGVEMICVGSQVVD